jgi:geranyl-CoA carboxylase alpha subunit
MDGILSVSTGMNTAQPLFGKVLVANRGEIAVRILRTCRRLGYHTVAVYSEADRGAPHTQLADEAVCIGAAAAVESYLCIPAILAAAHASGAQAVHPGYGFLSERADFAQAVQDAGLVFIGPDPASMQAMGNKSAARLRMQAAGVACVPGYAGADQDDATFAAEATRIGFPVMVKAAAGGGGRGMRLVQEPGRLAAALQSARSEAANAFGDGQLLLEKAVTDARHVEVQVFGDRHGQLVHIGERDCSIQRRHQKIIEESPSPAVDDALRARLGAAAVAAARTVDYVGAGTVEFLLAGDGQFWFLEMNTRLQVEHPVTELVYGLDLVEWQLRVAQGEALPLDQAQIDARRSGWAMEARLCAEDPAQDFQPQTGRVLHWQPAAGEGQRVDHGLAEGQTIGPHYDSLLAKLIAFGPTREAARRRLTQLLADSVLLGLPSNRDLLAHIVADAHFCQGNFSTQFLPQRFPAATRSALQQPGPLHQALAALLFHALDADALHRRAGLEASLIDWHSTGAGVTPLRLRVAQQQLACSLRKLADGGYAISMGEDTAAETLHIDSLDAHQLRFRHNGLSRSATYARDDEQLWLSFDGLTLCYEDRSHAATASADEGRDGQALAPMDGRIVALTVVVGENVQKGQLLAILEAMKMEFQITAPLAGEVAEITCRQGEQVKARQLLLQVRPPQV